jgi:pyocin large subunit-like protein
MAEKVKKAKAKAKLRTNTASVKTTVVKAAAVGKPLIAKAPSSEAIAKLAYRYWKERGANNGQDRQDWLRAERELKGA